MHRNIKNQKQGDKLLKMPGKNERGTLEFESHIAGKSSELLNVATRDVISVPQTSTIISAVGTMTSHGFRRLPVTDPGTNRIHGIVTAGDIIDFLGGGSRFNLVQVKHKGNLIAAINESVREIMSTKLITLDAGACFDDAVRIIVNTKCGGIPIVDREDRLVGIITERDVMKILSVENNYLTVEDIMTQSPYVTSPDRSIGDVAREMVSHKFRRLPVVSDDILFGIITTMDIMRYLGNKEIFNEMVTGDVSDVMGQPVRNLISGELYTISPDKNISEVAKKMLLSDIGALLVIENSRLVGLITEFDLVKALIKR